MTELMVCPKWDGGKCKLEHTVEGKGVHCGPHEYRPACDSTNAVCGNVQFNLPCIPYVPDTGKSASEVKEVAVGEFQPAKPDGCKTFPVERIPEANTQVCPLCHGDGLERCDNPDHGLLEALTGTKSSDIGRIGCPGCGHDPQHRTKDKCPACAGTGVLDDAGNLTRT